MGLLLSIQSKALAASRLSPTDWLLVAQSWVLLVVGEVALRIFGFSRIQQVIESAKPRRNTQVGDFNRLFRRISNMTDIAARNHILSFTCLRRSMVIAWLLRRRGVPATIHLGVRKDAPDFEAHAWVEYSGQRTEDIDELRRGYATFGGGRPTA